MHPKQFIETLNEPKIVAAINRAEEKTAAQIRVSVSHRNHVNALDAAKRYFSQSGMDKDPEHRAVLLFFAPRAHSFALWGDPAVHDKVGDAFWQATISKTTLLLKAGLWSQAVEDTIDTLGAELALRFPGRAPREA